MAFQLTELILESVIRDGLKTVKDSLGTSTDVIDDIFESLTNAWLNHYYGNKEINKIKEMVQKPINIVHGFSMGDYKQPTICINLVSNVESELYASMNDFLEEEDTDITPTTIVSLFDVDMYDDVSGLIDATSSNPDLSAVRAGQIFVDGDGNEYAIIGGITNEDGDKHFVISSGQDINLIGCSIISNVSISRRERKGVRESENLMISISTENALLTKYLYTIVKYILLSNKQTMIERGLEISSYDGSDFTRMDRLPENLFTRFLTLKANFIENTWLGGDQTIIGAADPAIKVRRDLYEREDEDEMTVQTVVEDDE